MGFLSSVGDAIGGAVSSIGDVFGGAGGAAINPMMAIGTASQIGGDLLAYQGAKDTNAANRQMAREQMAFQERMASSAQDFSKARIDDAHAYQERMSNTAYQRAMDDMREAGLNPILAYSQGGASTPIGQTAPGVSAVGQTAQMMNPAQVFSGTPKRVADVASSVADVGLTQAQTGLTREQQWKTYHEIGKVMADTRLTEEQVSKVHQEIIKLGREVNKIVDEERGIEADNVQRQIVADFLDSAEFAGVAKWIGISPQALGSIIRGVFLSRGRRR